MEIITFIISKFCVSIIDILLFAIMVRVLLSWIPLDENNRIEAFLFALTEPVIYPMRVIVDKFDSMRVMPIDIPLLLTSVLLVILSNLLSHYG